MLKKILSMFNGKTVDNSFPIICEQCGHFNPDILPETMEANEKFFVSCLGCNQPIEFIVKDFSESFIFTENLNHQVYQYLKNGKKKCIRIYKGYGLSASGRCFLRR